MRLPDRVEPGLVLKYGYLWSDEAESGREDGRKDRPAVVVLRREIVRNTLMVTVAAMTHSPPRAGQRPVMVPPAVKQRLGLDEQASWIVTHELNTFVWPGPDLRPIGRLPGSADDRCFYGYIPNSLLRKIVQGIADNRTEQRFKLVKRSFEGP